MARGRMGLIDNVLRQTIAHRAGGRRQGSCKLRHAPGALNSAVECHLHTVEVAGSNPAAPTNKFPEMNNIRRLLLGFPTLLACSWLHAQRPTLTTQWIVGQGARWPTYPRLSGLKTARPFLMTCGCRHRNRLSRVSIRSPASGVLLLDMRRAVASLKAIAPGADVHDALPWPVTFDSAGKQALYIFDGDIFLLDLDSSAFSRLTRTPAEEKDPQFSPNGRFVSFVRDNNIYVWDIAAGSRRHSSPTMVPRPR